MTSAVSMLAEQVNAQPDAIAVIDGTEQVSFRQLWDASGRIASSLHDVEVGSDDYIGIFMRPSVDTIVSIWGILRAGAAYLPLAVDYPHQRIEFMITDSGARHVIADPKSAEMIEHFLPRHVHLHVRDPLTYHRVGSSAPTAEAFPDPHGSAYVIYTSGSTGQPKGVVIPHSAIATQLAWLGRAVGLSPGGRILFKTPFSFDAAQWEILANACGSTIVVGPPGVHREPERICRLVQEHQVDLLQCVPTLWSALLEVPALRECGSLRHLFSGGEALPAALARALLAALPNANLVNLYGPTETTINATWLTVTPEQAEQDGAVSIGRPVPGCTVHVLDQDLAPCPPGRMGDLWIGGVQLATGYLHRPELTAERFVQVPVNGTPTRLYRTGDLVLVDDEGLLHFRGRRDDQVKVSGHRVETDEVRFAIEQHAWVRTAAVVPWTDTRDRVTRLAAFVELDPGEAALMDEGQAAAHHRSKVDKVAVKAQLSRAGIRTFTHGRGALTTLPNADGRPEQRRAAFARKTYRHYEGGPVDARTLAAACATVFSAWPTAIPDRPLDLHVLADVLRWLGPFHSRERLLPKFAYASPGALNATQVYLEITHVAGLEDGFYYFQPDDHSLIRLDGDGRDTSAARLRGNHDGWNIRLHMVGLPEVIETVYSTNIVEVLHFEAGHILGVLDRAVAEHGAHLRLVPHGDCPDPGLDEPWVHTATVDILPGPPPGPPCPSIDLTLQVHGKASGMRRGTYRFGNGRFQWVDDAIIERRHVIAINQASYGRSSFGVVLSHPRQAGWPGIVSLGRALQKLQMNNLRLGFMSSGYASLSGRDQQAAVRRDEIAARRGETESRLSYFAIGGSISQAQIQSVGMKEDMVHMQGPEELLREELRHSLPYYMVPAHVEIIDRIPLSSNGKQDRAALSKRIQDRAASRHRQLVAPENRVETEIAGIWSHVLNVETVSVVEDFFSAGGNSLSAVKLIGLLNQQFSANLPIQVMFETPTVRGLAERVQRGTAGPVSRIIKLVAGDGPPIIAWPGLGGYPMNLSGLAVEISYGRPVYAIQAYGLNAGEQPYHDFQEMISADGKAILDALDSPTVTLVGYSFGARMAAEVAIWLASAGVTVDQLVLIAPGSPEVPNCPPPTGLPSFGDLYFKKILMSVFTGSVENDLNPALSQVDNVNSFIELLHSVVPGFDSELAHRVIEVVIHTYGFRLYPACDMMPVLNRTKVLTATGDGPSFMDQYRGILTSTGKFVELTADHYAVLQEPSVQVTAKNISARIVQEV